ncbi:MAG: DUF5132 domain-containing protein [Leptolyngbyaceae bacterium]|nr:DUF5132 domain-containing protein [Leptolyngbyaceae bacterium]
MALDDIFKDFDGGFTGIALGIGVAVLAPILVPVVSGIGKPLIKTALKEGLLVYEKGKEVLAETTEVFEDILAEAKAELAEEQRAANANLAQTSPESIPIQD